MGLRVLNPWSAKCIFSVLFFLVKNSPYEWPKMKKLLFPFVYSTCFVFILFRYFYPILVTCMRESFFPFCSKAMEIFWRYFLAVMCQFLCITCRKNVIPESVISNIRYNCPNIQVLRGWLSNLNHGLVCHL